MKRQIRIQKESLELARVKKTRLEKRILNQSHVHNSNGSSGIDTTNTAEKTRLQKVSDWNNASGDMVLGTIPMAQISRMKQKNNKEEKMLKETNMWNDISNEITSPYENL